jgi:cytochrome c556
MSQHSPITYKENFQIDIINGLLHIYIPNAGYDASKVKLAVDIIDQMSSKFKIINDMNNTTDKDKMLMVKEDLDEISEEYRNFFTQKNKIQDTIKSTNKLLLEQLEEIQLPKIKKILTKLGTIENDNDFKCPFCSTWTGKNKASLAAHTRNCKFNPKNKDSSEIVISLHNTGKSK